MSGQDRNANPYLGVPGFEDTGPVDVGALLPGKPRELEIGFGKGRFILERAARNPGTSFLGIETRRKWVHLVVDRASRRSISNVEVRFGDARQIVKRMAPDGCFERVFVNFPDPWWKARHAKRMVVTAGLGEDLLRLIAPGGELFVQTDVDFRAAAYESELAKVDGLEGGPVGENPYGARSLREVRCEELGLPIYRLIYRKSGA